MQLTYEVIEKLISVKSEAELLDQFMPEFDKRGVKHFGYFKLDKYNPPDVLTTYPANWIERYVGENYQQYDSTVVISKRSNKPFTWGYARKLPIHEQSEKYWRATEQVGLSFGVSIPISVGISEAVGVGLCINNSNEQNWLNQYQFEMTVLANLMNYALIQIRTDAQNNLNIYKLTSRELECGRLLCTGTSFKRIGVQMHITERTVRFHIDRIKDKLLVGTKEEAIAKLVSLKLVPV